MLPGFLAVRHVKKAEEAVQMERELRTGVAHACAQQAKLATQLMVAHATIKQQALALDQQAAVTVTTFAEIQSAGQHVSGVRSAA